jgi:uncharacterized protein YndB with AHSA1/START domain
MSGTYERTFSVLVPVERAWRACTDPDELAQWFFTPTGTDDGKARFDLLGTEVAWTILELDPPRPLTASWIRGGELHHGSATMGPWPRMMAEAP